MIKTIEDVYAHYNSFTLGFFRPAEEIIAAGIVYFIVMIGKALLQFFNGVSISGNESAFIILGLFTIYEVFKNFREGLEFGAEQPYYSKIYLLGIACGLLACSGIIIVLIFFGGLLPLIGLVGAIVLGIWIQYELKKRNHKPVDKEEHQESKQEDSAS